LKIKYILLLIILSLLPAYISVLAQEEEPIVYFQMEPLDDSLFIHIQQELYIDPPDPKAEIIADLRNANNQTITIRSTLYPFLALSPEIRALIITYPFKLNLEEDINYTSIFTSVVNKIKISKIVQPPTKQQISSTLWYINPFLQMLGGERFGIPLKKDLGVSFGFQTRYEGPLNTNFVEVNVHLLGMYGGAFTHIDALIQTFTTENHNNLIVSQGYQIGYIFPFGNFFEISYLSVTEDFTEKDKIKYLNPARGTVVLNSDGSVKYKARLLEGSYLNGEVRYPIRVLGSTKGRIYAAKYLDEFHYGFAFREMSLAGSTFDLSFDAMLGSETRFDQLVLNLTVQKIAESWAFSALSVGPTIMLSRKADASWGVTKIFVNMRLKLGSSL